MFSMAENILHSRLAIYNVAHGFWVLPVIGKVFYRRDIFIKL